MEENEDKALTAEYVKELLTAVVTPLIEELQGLKDEVASVKASAQTMENDSADDEDDNEDDETNEDEDENEDEKTAKKSASHSRFGRRAFKDLSKRNAESRFRPYDDTNNTGKYEGLVREAFAKKGITMKARG